MSKDYGYEAMNKTWHERAMEPGIRSGLNDAHKKGEGGRMVEGKRAQNIQEEKHYQTKDIL
jgi:hypothetical protein